MRPPVQFTKKVLVTRSPGLNCVTPSPIATTSPAPSDSGITRKFGVAIGALDDALITIIQRCGAHAHQDLSVTPAADPSAR